jgi:hypothetical protein
MNSKIFIPGTKVKLYPGDTYKKSAEILEINDQGWVFKIIEAQQGCGYVVGEVIFLSHSQKLVMMLMYSRPEK